MVRSLVRFIPLFALASAAAFSASAQDPAADKPAEAPKADSGMDDKQKKSYAVGVQFGKAIADGASLIDTTALAAGLKDAMEKHELKLQDAEMNTLLQDLQKEIMEVRYGAAKIEGEAYLAENAKKDGVKTLPSGLQYRVLTDGTGRSPKATDMVQTHYRGTLTNGTEFDSSYKRNQPAEFPVNRVIAGWTEALQLMKEGSKWELCIPYGLAYGEQGRPPQIPPFSVLNFEVELIKIVDAPAGTSQPVTINPKPATPPPAPK